MRYLLKNGTVVSAEQSVQADVLIEGEKIIGVGKGLDENGAEVIDVSGKLLFPGFIDGHTHLTWKWQELLLRMISKQEPGLLLREEPHW